MKQASSPCSSQGRSCSISLSAITWMFAALSTVEPPIVQRESAMYLEGDQTWYEQRLPLVEERIRSRLDELSQRLGDAAWLDDMFSAGDLGVE